MKKVPGKYFWLLMTITGALMFGAPALVSASEGIASTDTENSAADNAADTPDDDTIAKTTDSAEKNSTVMVTAKYRKERSRLVCSLQTSVKFSISGVTLVLNPAM